MLQVERIFRQSQTLLRHCYRFFGNNVVPNFVLSTKSKRIKLFQLCRKDKISRKTRLTLLPNGNNVEATFDFVEATFDFVERIVRLVALDNVASDWKPVKLLLVWTGL